MKAGLLIAAAFLAVAVTPLHAATITVTSTADNGPGSLRDALATAADGDTIDASGVSGTILLTNGELLVTNSVDIVGPGPGLLAVDGRATSRVFYISPSNTVSISGLTITNGFADASFQASAGGGILNDNARLTVSNCTLSGNVAGFGGGILNNNATLEVIGTTLTFNGHFSFNGGGVYSIGYDGGSAIIKIRNSTLSGNSAENGGGIRSDGGRGTASVEIVNSIISSNSAERGGGIWNSATDGSASVQIANSTINGNSTRNTGQSFGGGIYNFGNPGGSASVRIANSTVSSNSTLTGAGGGIYNDSVDGTATVEIVNSTLSGNLARLATGAGGGIYNRGDSGASSVQIADSTVTGNSVTNGSDIFNLGGLEGSGSVAIGSTILNAGASGSTISNASGTVISLGYNLSSDDGGGLLTATGDQTNTDPMLGPLQDNGGPTFTCALLCGSPAIDQGKNFSGAATDQRGNEFVRTFDDCAVPNTPGGDGTDIGAYEVQRGECPHPPTMSCPTNETVNATSPAGATVDYPTPEASNGCPVSVVCNPASGSLFAIGDTIVSCVATDTEGNEATCSFTVHVKGAAEQIDDLIALVQSLNLKPWTACVLTADLEFASNALARGNTRWACGDLNGFIFDVEVQTWWGQIWPPSWGNRLVRNAQQIQSVLGCYNGFGPGHY
ncbi:MAG: choice-of-anchor Q domain-containing protein [Verrucomicrobiia bacterium]|jgi:hypothetical protein